MSHLSEVFRMVLLGVCALSSTLHVEDVSQLLMCAGRPPLHQELCSIVSMRCLLGSSRVLCKWLLSSAMPACCVE